MGLHQIIFTEASGCMPEQLLLTTKLIPSKRREHHVVRARLSEFVNLTPPPCVILVSAPAGYGKTTAISELCNDWRQQGANILWYTLDAGDNDPARFAAYLAAIFSQGLPEIFPDSHGAGSNLESTIVRLINHLSNETVPCVLILDDYHLITAPEVHFAVNLLLKNLPPAFRLVIGSRADPPLQLSRLRVRNHLVELRAGDLRFTREEVATFCQLTLGVRLSEQTTHLLLSSTEGWAVGLQLASMLLAQGASPPDDQTIVALTKALSRRDRAIFDYLAEEVFSQQPPELQRFLLFTSITSRFNSELCAALTGEGLSLPFLRDLDRANLFVTPIDDEAGWYRYHHLFGDFLRARLTETDPEQARALHRIAAEWSGRQGNVHEAIDHALLGSDYNLAAQLFTQQSWQPLIAQGELMTLWQWVRAFPDEVFQQHARLALYASQVSARVGHKQRADELLACVEHHLEQADPLDPAVQHDRGILAAYQSLTAANSGHLKRALELSKLAQQNVASSDRLISIQIARTNGFIYYNLGEMEAAKDALLRAMQLSREIGQHYWLFESAHWLALTYIKMGALKTATILCDDLAAAYPVDFGPTVYVLTPRGIIATEHNDLALAEALFVRAVEMARREKLMDALWIACVGLARVHLFRREFEPVPRLLEEGFRAAEALGNEVVLSIAKTVNARLWLARGDLERVRSWVEDYLSHRPTEYPAELEDLTLSRVWVELGDDGRALGQLEQIIQAARSAGRNARLIEALILQTALFERSGNHSAADAALYEALDCGEAQGYLRTFIDHAAFIEKPLRRAEANFGPFVRRIVTPAPIHHIVLDSLTAREGEVLILLARGATNQDIAADLVIGLGTVKSHINHIMSKLNARNRTEAVALARAASLID